MQSPEFRYRKTAAEGASGLGLLIALYDTLAGNLRRAADAERSNDLENRCAEMNHALLVIGYLEDCIERAGGGDLAQRLVILYSSLRRKLIEAQVKRSPTLLEEQMEVVLRIRESWQAMDLASPDGHAYDDPALQTGQEAVSTTAAPRSTSWSA